MRRIVEARCAKPARRLRASQRKSALHMYPGPISLGARSRHFQISIGATSWHLSRVRRTDNTLRP